MARTKVFISYSRAETDVRDEVLRALRAVPRINRVLWWDEGEIDIGDKFHPKIQQGLAESKIGILLLSNYSFTSDYILKHELPYLIQHAEEGDLKLGCLYLTAIAEAAFEREIDIDGGKRTINLKDYVGAHAPNQPLDTLDKGARAQVYKNLADWVTGVLDVPDDRPDRQRSELGVTLRARRNRWEHSFWLPPATQLQRPELDTPHPDVLFGYPSDLIDGENLFHLLFGNDPQKSGNILGAAFGVSPPVDPTLYPLRVRLVTNDERLWALPWGKIAYQGRRLAEVGWTVELHDASGPGMPEYPLHTCYFPGKVLLFGAHAYMQTPQAAAHLADVEHFFQSRWPKAVEPLRVNTTTELRDVLRTGSTRLLYYIGSASSEGLLADGAAACVPWSEVGNLLEQAQSVSAVFLNLLGEESFAAMAPARHLLPGAWAVLVQCRGRSEVETAGREAINWLQHVFAANARLDPVVALYGHPRGQVTAWTRYGSWRTTPLPRFDIPELVERLLDRHRQRNDLAGAKEEFYQFTERRIHHTVAFGEVGARVAVFPLTVSQHLRETRREQEVFRHHSFTITTRMDTIERVDQRVRQELGIGPRASVSGALLKADTLIGHGFWFLVLGWFLAQRLDDNRIEEVEAPLRAVADWCRTRLLPELLESPPGVNLRAVSVVAIETASATGAEQLRGILDDMMVELNDTESFHVGELDPLARVRLSDLTNYFRNRQVCSCHDQYRDRFPRLLLGERRDMPFDEAVDTIRRGYPDNWGNLFEDLETMSEAGTWPPDNYDATFWETRDGRRAPAV
jgi:hypothetical protein